MDIADRIFLMENGKIQREYTIDDFKKIIFDRTKQFRLEKQAENKA